MPSFGSLQFYHIKIDLAEIKNSRNCFQQHICRKTLLTGLLRLRLWVTGYSSKSSFQEGNFTTARLRHVTPFFYLQCRFRTFKKTLKKTHVPKGSHDVQALLLRSIPMWLSEFPHNLQILRVFVRMPSTQQVLSGEGIRKTQLLGSTFNTLLALSKIHRIHKSTKRSKTTKSKINTSMKNVYVKTSVGKVKTPWISSSSTVLKAFSPDFQAWTALEVLPQPRAFKERAVLGIWKIVGPLEPGGKHTQITNLRNLSPFLGGFRVRIIPSLISRT